MLTPGPKVGRFLNAESLLLPQFCDRFHLYSLSCLST